MPDLPTLMLDDILQKLGDLHELQLEERAKGEIIPVIVEVSGEEEKEVKFAPPISSFSVFNDGPDEVYPPMVNRKVPVGARTAPLRKSESLRYDARRPAIRVIYLACPRGKSASVRVYGMR